MKTPGDPLHILIVCYSRFGAVGALAERIAEGARRVAGVEVHRLDVDDQPVEEARCGEGRDAATLGWAAAVHQLASADALIVGAPAYFGSMASPVKRLFEDCAAIGNPPVADRSRPWYGHLFRDKVGAAFTASATLHGGNEQALHSILTMMMHLGMIVVTPGQREPILETDAAPYGATAIAGPDGDRAPTDAEREAARDLGQRVAEVTAWVIAGQAVWWNLPHHRRFPGPARAGDDP